MTTNQKGAIAEAAIAYEAVKLGIGVWRPLLDEPCDLILDFRPRILRVQCKWALRRGDVVSINMRRCRRSREGLVHRSYGADEIDAIAAYCAELETCYLLPRELSVERTMVLLRLRATRNNQSRGIRWAREYELGARLSHAPGP